MAESRGPLVFLSYARQDGAETAALLDRLLRDLWPGCDVWIDTEDADPAAQTFTQEIQSAIERSAAALFVMTEVSRTSSWCDQEANHATICRVPRAVVFPHAGVQPSFVLNSVPVRIDLFDEAKGRADLRRFVERVRTPRAVVDELRAEQEQLKASAVEATGTARERLDAREREVAEELAAERDHVADPDGARRRMEQRIEDDLTADSSPDETPRSGAGPVRVINEPAGVAPPHFHDRDEQVQRLRLLLARSAVRLIALTGRYGMGKTALLFRLPEMLGRPPLDGYRAVVFLDACGYRQVTAATLLDGLAQTLDEPAATAVRARIEEPVSAIDKLETVLTELAGRGVLAVIDGAEELLDETHRFRDRELEDVCREIALGDHGVRILFVTQDRPEPLFREVGRRAQEVPLDAGLPMPEAGEFVRMLDDGNRLGASARDDGFLARLRDVTEGSPRSLELFYGVLRADPYTRPGALLAELEALGERADVAGALFDRMLARLRDTELQVIEALASYGRPVRPGAVDHLLVRTEGGRESTGPLRRLEEYHLVRRDGERFYLPARDARQILGRIPEGEPADRDRDPMPHSRIALYHRAAEFHALARGKKRRIERPADLDPHLGEITMRMAGGEHRAALALMNAIDRDHLQRWGQSSLLLRLRGELAPHLRSVSDRLENLSMIAAALFQQERYDEGGEALRTAIRHAGLGLRLGWWADLWRQRGAMELRRGAPVRANRMFRRALRCSLLFRWRLEEARARLNLAVGLADLGRFDDAIGHIQAALAIGRGHEIGPDITGRLLLQLGWIHHQAGRDRTALEAVVQARGIAEEEGETVLAAYCALHRAQVLVDGDHPEKAVGPAQEACETGYRVRDAELLCGAGVVLTLAALRVNDLSAATEASRVSTLHRDSRSVPKVHLMNGIVAFRRDGRRDGALQAFTLACTRFGKPSSVDPNAYQAHNLYGLIMSGLALCGEKGCLPEAVAAFERARAAVAAPGAARRNELVLDQFGPSADPALLRELVRATSH